jgi:hypothetical protein
VQPREIRQRRIVRQVFEDRHGAIHVAGAEFDPAQRQLIDERPTAAARLDRLPRATQVAGPHGVHEGNHPGQFLPGGILGQVLGDAAAMSQRPNAAFAKTAFEIRSGLPGSARRARSKYSAASL